MENIRGLVISFILLAAIVAGGIFLYRTIKKEDTVNCNYFKNYEFRDVPARCITYFEYGH